MKKFRMALIAGAAILGIGGAAATAADSNSVQQRFKDPAATIPVTPGYECNAPLTQTCTYLAGGIPSTDGTYQSPAAK